MRYLDEQQIKDYCRNEIPTDDDEWVIAAGDAAEDAIDQACQRRFFVAGGTAEDRVYQIPDGTVLRFHDAVEVSAIAGVAGDAYRLEPLNGLSWAGEARPYEQARLTSESWPYRTDGLITVTAKWGWTAIPPRIVQAALIVAKEIIVNRDEVKLGLIGFSDVGGVVARTNPIVRDTVQHYRRVESWGVG